MLTRLRVSGFKNLVAVDVRFGPFTCIAGPNGAGKSNLFDAVELLSSLADRPLLDAALSVRTGGSRTGDVRSLFHRVGQQHDRELSFEAEMIVPRTGVDDLGQTATATITFLRYQLVLAIRVGPELPAAGPLEVVSESLAHINIGEARQHLRFGHKPAWRNSVVSGRRSSNAPFISTSIEDGKGVIELHQDGRSGRPLRRAAAQLPRTVLSVVNAAESPTALLARNEMRSWRRLQLEPALLRQPDPFTAPTRLAADGAHLAATLARLAKGGNNGRACAEVTNRLAELIEEVTQVEIERDEKRELLTLEVAARDGTRFPARDLSDGTLRFLALAVLERDPEAQGLLCLEEPENGIHPLRVPAMIELLRDMATDVAAGVDADNPLRQVIVNTHSPAVVAQVPDDSLLVAEPREQIQGDVRFPGVRYAWLPGTWRAPSYPGAADPGAVARGALLAYLNPAAPAPGPECHRPGRRVVDRDDLAPFIPGLEAATHE